MHPLLAIAAQPLTLDFTGAGVAAALVLLSLAIAGGLGAVLVGEPIPARNTYFGLGSAAVPATVDDVSDFLDSVEPSSDTDELDATTFRRTQRNYKAGFTTKGYSLSGKWSPEADTFFAALEGLSGVKYEHGPEGKAAGDVKISGLATVLSYSGPTGGVDDIASFTVELRTETTVRAVFP
jgi:hypothetical protein